MPTNPEGRVSLFLSGSEHPQYVSGCPLYIPAHDARQSPLNVAITGGGPRAGGSVPLYLHNVPPATRSLKVFLKGPDGTPGAVPSYASMNVHCEWGAQGVLPLVLNPGVVDGSLPAWIRGRATGNASVDVAIVGEGGVLSGVLDVSLPAAPSASDANSSVELAMPHVHGEGDASLTTFVNGWEPF